MTKNTKNEHLTEQWKKGQLEGFRWYYVKFKTGEIDICWLIEWSNDELGTGGQYFDGIKEENILEILSPVPSYEEWQKLKSEYEAECKRADELEDLYWKEVEKNKKLKDLLKECREKLNSCCPVLYSNLIKQIDEVLK